MKACTAKGWAVWLFLVVLAVGRAEAEDNKNIVADNLEPVCDLSAALKFVAAKAKEARSCIPDDAAGEEGTDTVLFAKAFGAAWRWGADNTNDTVRGILLETRVFAQRAERAQRIAAISEHLAAMAREKADRIDEFVRMLANYKASSGNGYCLGDGSGQQWWALTTRTQTTLAPSRHRLRRKSRKTEGMQQHRHNSHGLRKGKVGKQRSRKSTGGSFSGIRQPVDNRQRHSRQRRQQRGSIPTGQGADQWSRRLHRRQDHIRRHVHRKNKHRPRTAFQGQPRHRARRRPGLDYKAHATHHSRRHRTATEEVPVRAKHRHRQATTDATALAKAAAAIYDELQAREAAHNARRNTPKEQGKGKQHATASPSSTERKEEEGSSQARSETMEKQTDAAHRSEDTSEARAWHALLAACSAAAMATRT
ncbi:putative Trypanosome variant surface glycoprotein (A type) [Trypanosoma vivax]|nr:putative Trypanosome variant surface glycoprotein (A type) [Trypanosoma vivax]